MEGGHLTDSGGGFHFLQLSFEHFGARGECQILGARCRRRVARSVVHKVRARASRRLRVLGGQCLHSQNPRFQTQHLIQQNGVNTARPALLDFHKTPDLLPRHETSLVIPQRATTGSFNAAGSTKETAQPKTPSSQNKLSTLYRRRHLYSGYNISDDAHVKSIFDT